MPSENPGRGPRSVTTPPSAAFASSAAVSSGAAPAPGVVSSTLPRSSSTCASASPEPLRRPDAAPGRTSAAASPARASSPSSIARSRLAALSSDSVTLAPISSTAITPVKASASLMRSGARAHHEVMAHMVACPDG